MSTSMSRGNTQDFVNILLTCSLLIIKEVDPVCDLWSLFYSSVLYIYLNMAINLNLYNAKIVLMIMLTFFYFNFLDNDFAFDFIWALILMKKYTLIMGKDKGYDVTELEQSETGSR